MNTDDMAWAESLASRHAWVMHTPTETISQIEAFHEKGKFISKVNNMPVQAPVMELASGDAFIAAQDNFVELTENEAGFYNFAQRAVNDVLADLVKKCAVAKIPAQTSIVLIASVLRTQIASLHKQEEQAPPSTKPELPDPA
jgi:hypothetical protein